ncbi:MAG: ribosomal protein S18-alanine N-acetyltransferase [Clostridiales Family XIII bacterium]|jgi:ribosomal-protein-alanine N-acetyltransferase|nr:ribosomal protein S18-alanine N-acetyltransferase [Clostridiales Family XIII bacterium]
MTFTAKHWIKIRRATGDDVDAITEVEKRSFPKPWSREDFEKDICDNILATYVLAETRKEVIGYAGIWVVIDEGHITNVAVHPDWRDQGIATMIILSMLDAAREKGATRFTLEVRTSNAPAIALYEKFGFRAVGIRKKYYENGEDAAIMWKYDENDKLLTSEKDAETR